MADRRLRRGSAPSERPTGEVALRQALIDRVGPLGWVVEGCIESVGAAGISAASALWGEEAIDLLWERGLLVATDVRDIGADETRLADDAQRWVEARRVARTDGFAQQTRLNRTLSACESDVFVERLSVLRWSERPAMPAMSASAEPSVSTAIDERELVGI